MGNASSMTNWPEIIFMTDCPRQKVFEQVFSPDDALRDWLHDEVHEIEVVRDGEVAPGLLFKTTTEEATCFIEWTGMVVDGESVGTHISWNFYRKVGVTPLPAPDATITAPRTPAPATIAAPRAPSSSLMRHSLLSARARPTARCQSGQKVHDPSDPKPLHSWVKENADLTYSSEFSLSDGRRRVDVGHTKVVRKTTQYSNKGASWFPYWSTHKLAKRQHPGKQWPWHTLP
ncbi:hypothetical protein T492DRAFT_881150 [Pavlovales sp. CCMP2436]|nr:hypothetical protein T492DRAFT_881150 [Pavlovales sp. CCMP2436]